jgi:hypothetical protein
MNGLSRNTGNIEYKKETKDQQNKKHKTLKDEEQLSVPPKNEFKLTRYLRSDTYKFQPIRNNYTTCQPYWRSDG